MLVTRTGRQVLALWKIETAAFDKLIYEKKNEKEKRKKKKKKKKKKSQ
jgi:hypothetical protein